jgi:hypothetical protein
VSKIKNLLFVVMMILASLLFIVTGASAQYCSTFLPSCHWQEAAGMRAQQGNEELGAAISGEQQRAGEFGAAVSAPQDRADQMTPAAASGEHEKIEEMVPAGSSHPVEYGTTGKGPYEGTGSFFLKQVRRKQKFHEEAHFLECASFFELSSKKSFSFGWEGPGLFAGASEKWGSEEVTARARMASPPVLLVFSARGSPNKILMLLSFIISKGFIRWGIA